MIQTLGTAGRMGMPEAKVFGPNCSGTVSLARRECLQEWGLPEFEQKFHMMYRLVNRSPTRMPKFQVKEKKLNARAWFVLSENSANN